MRFYTFQFLLPFVLKQIVDLAFQPFLFEKFFFLLKVLVNLEGFLCYKSKLG